MTWRHLNARHPHGIPTMLYGDHADESNVEAYKPQVTTKLPGVIKVSAKTAMNRREQQSRKEAAAAPRYKTVTMAELIRMGLLPPGSDMRTIDSARLRRAVEQYRALPKQTGPSANTLALRQAADEEYEFIHKNADNTGKGSLRGKRK